MPQQTPWRRDQKILERMRRANELRLRGWSSYEIGAELGVSHVTILTDLKRCDELYREHAATDIESRREVAIRRLEQIVTKGLEAYEWDRAAERALLTGDLIDGKPIYHDDKGSVQFRGNKAAALAIAEKATMDIAKLQGLVIDKAALTDADGNSLAALIARVRADASSNN